MAQYNTANNSYQAQSKTLFEVNQIALANGHQVDNNNRFPVDIGNTSISITGNVNINFPSTVTVNSTPDNPVHNHITEVGNSGLLTVPYLPIGGNVSIFNSNGFSITNTAPLPVTGNIVITSVTANVVVSVNNFPTSQNVNILHSNSSNITNAAPLPITGNVNALVINTANNPVLTKYADDTNTQLDSVGRLRVSPPLQSYWYTPSIDKDGDLRYQESFVGNGNSYFIQNLANIRMTSGNTYNANASLTGSAIRLSRRRHKLRPTVSLEWTSSMNWSGAETNVTKRRGFFTQYNGVFFEVSGGDISFNVRRRLEEGTLVTVNIPRSTWNYDKLDGTNSATNPSGININPATTANSVTITGVASKSGPVSPQNSSEQYYDIVFNTSSTSGLTWLPGQHVVMSGLTPSTLNGHGMMVSKTASTVTISYLGDPGTYLSGTGTIYSDGLYKSYTWWIDFDGDRTSRLRFGIMTREGPTVCHIEDYTANLGTKWANAPAMPDRMEIFNTGIPSYNPAMFIGATAINVEAELALNPGFGAAISNSFVIFDKTTDVNKEHAILGVGLRSGEPYQRGDLQIQRIQITDIGNANPAGAGIFQWRLVLNPAYAGTSLPTPSDIGKASRQWSYANGTTISSGITLMAGYAQGTQIQDTQTALNFLNIGSNVDNSNADIVVLAVKLLAGGTADSKIVGILNIIESL